MNAQNLSLARAGRLGLALLLGFGLSQVGQLGCKTGNPNLEDNTGMPDAAMGEPAFGERSNTGARTKLDVAKEQLTGLLAALVGDVRFNIVAFSTRVWPWRS